MNCFWNRIKLLLKSDFFVAPISFAFSDNFSLLCGIGVKFNRITIETFCEYNTKKIALNKYLSRML